MSEKFVCLTYDQVRSIFSGQLKFIDFTLEYLVRSYHPRSSLVLELIPNRYAVGDLLWVKESWAYSDDSSIFQRSYRYRGDYESPNEVGCKWRSSVHMPRAAARLFLRVNDIVVKKDEWGNPCCWQVCVHPICVFPSEVGVQKELCDFPTRMPWCLTYCKDISKKFRLIDGRKKLVGVKGQLCPKLQGIVECF